VARFDKHGDMLVASSWMSLLLFATVVSQPLFYWLALGRATRQLSARAYVELRQQVNLAIKQRLTRLYLGTLLSLLGLIVYAFVERAWWLAMGAWVALIALVLEVVLAHGLPVQLIADAMHGDDDLRSHGDLASPMRRDLSTRRRPRPFPSPRSSSPAWVWRQLH
jgi:hypothetical protein